jgi:hypothetical protein
MRDRLGMSQVAVVDLVPLSVSAIANFTGAIPTVVDINAWLYRALYRLVLVEGAGGCY